MGGTRSLGELIVGGRAAHDPPLTQVQLAERVGVRQETVSRWEGGKRVPPLPMLDVIADALGLDVDLLVQAVLRRGPGYPEPRQKLPENKEQ